MDLCKNYVFVIYLEVEQNFQIFFELPIQI